MLSRYLKVFVYLDLSLSPLVGDTLGEVIAGPRSLFNPCLHVTSEKHRIRAVSVAVLNPTCILFIIIITAQEHKEVLLEAIVGQTLRRIRALEDKDIK